jgi:hypothetical protein
MPKLDMLQEVAAAERAAERSSCSIATLTPRSYRSSRPERATSCSCRRLKKMKLDLKDKIQQIENMLIPDIIA